MKPPLANRLLRLSGRMSKTKSYSRGISVLILEFAVMLCIQVSAAPKKNPLPDEVASAKSVYIVNETGNPAVLDAANEQFTKWGRFAIAKSRDKADLVVVFTHKYGMDKLGNTAFIEMNIFPRSSNKPVFQTRNAHKLIFEPQRRTIACINDFKKRLEQQHQP